MKLHRIISLAALAAALAFGQSDLLPVPTGPQPKVRPARYEIYFTHLKNLDNEAAKLEAQGKHNGFNTYEQRLLKFTDEQMAILKQIGAECVEAYNTWHAEYISALKAYRNGAPPNPKEPLPLELRRLGGRGHQILAEHVQELRQQLGDQAFFHLDDYIYSDQLDGARRTRVNTKENPIEAPPAPPGLSRIPHQ